MSKISTEATPVTNDSSEGLSSLIGLTISGHTLLIYKDDAGIERAVRGRSRLDRDD